MAQYYNKSAKEWVISLCEEQRADLKWKISYQSPGQDDIGEENYTCSLTCQYTNQELHVQASGSSEEEAKENCAFKFLFSFLGFTKPQLFILQRNDLEISDLKEYLVPLDVDAVCNKIVVGTGVPSQAYTNAIQDEVLEAEEAGFVEGSNYIGSLQEECVKRKLQIPSYHEIERSGPPHMPVFNMKCIVGPVQKFGKKPSKQAAKSLAAYKVLETLKAYGFNFNDITEKSLWAIEKNEEIQVDSVSSTVLDNDELNEVVEKMREITLLEPDSLREEFTQAYQGLIYSFIGQELSEGQKKHALFILRWISERAGIKLVVYEPLLWLDDNEGSFHGILKLRLPFKNYSPSFLVVEDTGATKTLAVQNCALSALRLLVE